MRSDKQSFPLIGNRIFLDALHSRLYGPSHPPAPSVYECGSASAGCDGVNHGNMVALVQTNRWAQASRNDVNRELVDLLRLH
jgi:hypothetical protein